MIVIIITGILILLAVFYGAKVVDKSSADIPNQVLQWKKAAQSASEKTGVPWRIILATIWVESAGRQDATGSAGEIGLMQLKAIAVQDVRHFMGYDPSDWKVSPVKNIITGAYYLKLQHERTGSWERAIQAYNQGVQGANENPQLAASYYQKVKAKQELL